MAGAAARGGCRDRGRRYQGRRARQGRPDVHHDHRHRAAAAGCLARCRQRAAGDQVLLSGPIGDHGITILLARGELDLEADLRSDTRSVLPLVEALVAGGGAGHPLDARPDPRRRRHVAQRAGARLRTRGVTSPRRRSRCATRCAAPASCSASTRCTSPTKASSSPSSPPEQADRGPGGAASGVQGGDEAAIIGEIRDAAGARRTGDDPLRRHPHRRHAGRRPAAADLLMSTASWRRSRRVQPCLRRWIWRPGSSTASSPATRSSRRSSRARRRGLRRLPRDVRALPPRRPAAGVRSGALRHRRAARLGGVRASRDRRQAGAAGARPVACFRPLARGARPAGRHGHGLRAARRRRRGHGWRSHARPARGRHDLRAARARRARTRSRRAARIRSSTRS